MKNATAIMENGKGIGDGYSESIPKKTGQAGIIIPVCPFFFSQLRFSILCYLLDFTDYYPFILNKVFQLLL